MSVGSPTCRRATERNFDRRGQRQPAIRSQSPDNDQYRGQYHRDHQPQQRHSGTGAADRKKPGGWLDHRRRRDGGTVVNIAGTGGVRTLAGLKDGLNGTDAVTVAQINNLTGGQLNVVQYETSLNGGPKQQHHP